MLMENVLSYMSGDVESIPMVRKLDIYTWVCPECKEWFTFTLDEVDDRFVDNMLRNPSDEVWICPKCGKMHPITTGMVNVTGTHGNGTEHICSDGTFLYLISEEKAYRV